MVILRRFPTDAFENLVKIADVSIAYLEANFLYSEMAAKEELLGYLYPLMIEQFCKAVPSLLLNQLAQINRAQIESGTDVLETQFFLVLLTKDTHNLLYMETVRRLLRKFP